MILVVELADDAVRRIDAYTVEDLPAALNRYEEIVGPSATTAGRADPHRAYRLACGIDDDHWIARNWDALTSFDAARYEQLLAADFRSVDHRPVTFGVVGRDEFLEWLRATPPEASWSIPAIHRLSDRGMVVEHMESWADAAGDTRMLIVIEFGDGLTKRMDTYEIDDLAVALARNDEIAGTRRRTLTNAAWEAVQQGAAMWRQGDRDGFAGFLADDFVATTNEPIMAAIDDDQGAYDKERYLDAMFDPLVFGPASSNELDLIAVRGDELCVSRTRTMTPEGDVHERIVSAEVLDGRCVRMEVFAHGQLSEAQIALDRRWLTLLGFAEDHPWFELVGLFYDTDSTVIARALADDFQYLDHRKLSFPDGDRSQILANADTLLEATEVVIPRYPRLSDRHTLGERIEQTVGGADHSGGLHLSALDADGRIAYMEVFEVDDEAAAIAAFDRLLAEERASQAGLGPLTNAAWECVRTGRTLDGANGWHQLIAVRSDRYCLTRFAATDPDAQTVLVVSEIVDGRVERSTCFEADDLAAALIELDAWYLSEIDEPEIHDWMFRLAAAFGHGTFEDFRSLVTDDFESVDERRLGLGRRTADEWAASYVLLVGLQHPVVTRVVRHDGPIWLSEYWARSGVDGSEWHSLLLIERDGHRIRRSHEFDLEQAERAFARYEELVAAQIPGPPVPHLTNRAWEIAAAFAAAFAAGDRDGLDRLVDPDGEVESRGQLSAFGAVSGRGFLDVRLSVRPGSDEGRQDIEIVAVRGEHHCLVLVDRWLHGDPVRLPILVETDDERIIRMVWFDDDQLIDAQLELDRRWFESIGYADHWWEPIRLTMYDPHPDAMFEHLAPDFEYVDHRPLMFPSGDAEQLRSNIHSMQHDVVFTIPRVHRISDAGSVLERIETAVGEIGQTHVVFVSQFVGQRVQRMEAFDITQLDLALARYDELTHG